MELTLSSTKILELKGVGLRSRVTQISEELGADYTIIADSNQIYVWNEKYYEPVVSIAFCQQFKRLFKKNWTDYNTKMGKEGYDLLLQEKWLETFKVPEDKLLFKNGLFNLKTRELTGFDPRFHFVSMLPYRYDDKGGFDWKTNWKDGLVGCPLFHYAMLTILPNAHDRMKVLQYMRYCLSKSIRHGFAQIWMGKGSNAKTSLMEFIADLLGDLAGPFSMAAFSKERGHLTMIKDKNLVICSEIGGVKLSTAAVERLKEMVTDKKLTARASYGREMCWINTTKALYGSQKLPSFQEKPSEMAFWRRWDIIEFTQCFDGREDKTLFRDILKYEAGAVISYLLKEIDWHDMERTPWEDVRTYWLNACSSVIRFIDSECIRDAKPDKKNPSNAKKAKKVLANDLYALYIAYMNEKEAELEPDSDKKFINELRRNGIIRTQSTDKQWYYRGIQIDYSTDEEKEAQAHIDQLATASLDSDCEYKQRSYQERQAEIETKKAAATEKRLAAIPGYEKIAPMSDAETDALIEREDFYND